MESLLGTSIGVFVGLTLCVMGFAAYMTGQHQFLIDPDDPLGAGFILR